MIRVIQDVVWKGGEADGDRIRRWADNARKELSEATADEVRIIIDMVTQAKKSPNSYPFCERILRDMGCIWMLYIVEPDRTLVALERKDALARATPNA